MPGVSQRICRVALFFYENRSKAPRESHQIVLTVTMRLRDVSIQRGDTMDTSKIGRDERGSQHTLATERELQQNHQSDHPVHQQLELHNPRGTLPAWTSTVRRQSA
jgi:hypothetical protein